MTAASDCVEKLRRRATLNDAKGNLFLLSSAVFLGLCIRLFRVELPPLKLDDYTSLMFTLEPLKELLGSLWNADVHPPYYYSLQKVWNDTFGTSRTIMRLLPILLATACIPFVYFIGLRLAGSQIAIISVFILSASPMHVFQSRELRMYPLLNLSAIVSLAGLAYVLSQQKRGEYEPTGRRGFAWLAYVLGTVSSFYAHNSGILLPVVCACIVSILFLLRFVGRKVVVEFSVASFVALFLIAPGLYLMLKHTPAALTDYWIPETSLRWAYSQITGTYPYPPWGKVVFFVLALLGALAFRYNTYALVLVLGVVVLQPLLLLIISLFKPVLIVRGLVWPTMFFCILVAAGILYLPTWLRIPAIVVSMAAQVQAIAPLYPSTFQSTLYPSNFTGDEVSGLKSSFDLFDPTTDQLVIAGQWFEVSMRWEFPQLFSRKVIAINYADRDQIFRKIMKSELIRREDVAKLEIRASRIWLITEVEPLVPTPAGDDMDGAIASIRNRGEVVRSATVGNTRLIVIHNRGRAISGNDNSHP